PDGRGQRRRAPQADAHGTSGDAADHRRQARSRPVGAGLLRRVRRPAEEAGRRESDGGLTLPPRTSSDGRDYPDRPVLGVGAVVLVDGKVILVKRAHEPLKGRWNLPGGAVELGETLREACAREVLEETGLVVDVGDLIELFDRIML